MEESGRVFEFKGPVRDVIGRDVVTHHHHSHGRLLTKDERIDLNKLVQQLEDEFNEPRWQTWKFLHRTIGVQTIEEMCLGHRDQALAILNLLMDNATVRAKLRADEVAALTTKLNQSTSALTALTAQNGEHASRVTKLEAAYRSLEGKYQQQSGELKKALANERAALDQSSRPAPACRQCDAARTAIARSRRATLWTCLLAVFSVSMAAYFGYQSVRKGAALQLAESRLQACEYNGKSYGLGSIVDGPGAADLECAVASATSVPQWKTIKPSGAGNKKSVVPNKRPQRQDGELVKGHEKAASDTDHAQRTMFTEQ